MRNSVRRSQRFGSAARSVLLLFLAWPSLSNAQTTTSSEPRPVFAGSVRDSASGRPVVRAFACSEPEGQSYARRCTHADSLGRFLLGDLPFGVQKLVVTCYGVRTFDGQWIVTDSVRLTSPDTIVRHLVIDAAKQNGSRAGCDMRPFREERVTMTGHWSLAFEQNEFRPCGESIVVLPRVPMSMYESIKWPPLRKGTILIGREVFVRFEGVIRGPAIFGGADGNGYALDVERVHWVEATGEC